MKARMPHSNERAEGGQALRAPVEIEPPAAPSRRLIEETLHGSDRAERRPVHGVVLARLSGVTEDGVLVDFGHGAPTAARAMAALGPHQVGRQVAVMFEGGDTTRPVVMGVIERLDGGVVAAASAGAESSASIIVEEGGRRVVVQAEDELVLRSGDTSLTLRSSGKALLQGEEIVSHASGLNRVAGRAVRLSR